MIEDEQESYNTVMVGAFDSSRLWSDREDKLYEDLVKSEWFSRQFKRGVNKVIELKQEERLISQK